MKKRSNKSFLASAAYLVVALVLCAGVIFYTGNGGTGLISQILCRRQVQMRS